MIDTIFNLLQGLLLPALVAAVVSVVFAKYHEARKARADACRQLRDLLDELRVIVSKTTNAATFDFRDVPHSRWDALVPEPLRRDASDVYKSCEATYELLAHLNEGSAEVRRRGQVRQYDEGIAKKDVGKEVAPLNSAATATHATLAAHIARVCR